MPGKSRPRLTAAEANGPKVSTREYEELIEIYQAQNAIGVARAAGADQYAPEPIAKADTLFVKHSNGMLAKLIGPWQFRKLAKRRSRLKTRA